MAEILGVSFSDNQLYLGRYGQRDGSAEVLSVKGVPYPFKFRYDTMFAPELLGQMAELIRQQNGGEHGWPEALMVVLPENYAFHKRVPVPLNSDKALLKAQAQWELSALLPDEIASYKIIKTDHSFFVNTYEEYLFVAIRRSVLQALQQLAQRLQMTLQSVLLEDVALRQFLDSAGLRQDDKNQLILKIEQNSLKRFLFRNGKFYHSGFDLLAADGHEVARKTTSLIKRRYNESVALLEQLSGSDEVALQLLYWGGSINDELRAILKETFTQEIYELTAKTAMGSTPAVDVVGLLQG